MNHEELRQWLKDNLEICVEYIDSYGPLNDVRVGLRLKGDTRSFTYETIHLPSNELS